MNVAMLVQGAASLSWLVAIVVVVLAVIRASRGQKVKGFGTLVILIVVMAIVLTTVSAGLVFLQPEERGVVISAIAPNGYREAVLQPGLRWVIPFAENVVRYKISKQTYTMSIAPSEGQIQGDDSVTARTADGQEIFIDSSVIFAVNPEKVIDVHIAWQDRYIDDLVRPLARGVIRDAVSQFGVEEVVSTKRYELRSQIEEALSTSLSENGLVLVDFVLRNITFSPEYAASVEQKQIAEQQAQQAKFVVEQKKQEAEQAREFAKGQADAQVIKAQGEAQALVIQAQAEAEARLIQAKVEAQALELLAQAIQANPDVLTLEYIQKLSPGIQVMLVPSDNPFLLPLPSLEQATSATPVATPEPTPEE
jgi:regulator of protease activity HflC (stomatin/prohibitin superfamily)